jgi:hypothetical protein
MRTPTKFWLEYMNRTNHSEDLGIDERIMTPTEIGLGIRNGLTGLSTGTSGRFL